MGVLALVILGGAALIQVVRTAPAFNADLRANNAFGETALLLGRDMYDQSAYLYQQAASFVRADLVTAYDADGATQIASVELTVQRAQQAALMLNESLAHDPGHAGAWTLLAWAHLFSGESAQARQALNISWQLAPYSYVLSEERIALSLVLFGQEKSLPLAKVEYDGLLGDSKTLWYQRGLLHRLYGEEAALLGLPVYLAPKTQCRARRNALCELPQQIHE